MTETPNLESPAESPAGADAARPLRIATFNVNGIKARADVLPAWIASARPDLLCLQEIKSVDEAFPRETYEALGYQVETHGQKGFNGVAILSRLPLSDLRRGLAGDAEDTQARWIEARVAAARPFRLCALYLPNGNPVPGPKYAYKLAWMARMQARVAEILASEEPAIFAGDYNIIPQAEDAARPAAWTEDALYRLESRQAYRRLLHLGLSEALRLRDPRPGLYSFWDYQAGAWPRNDGIRIDHLLMTPQAADRLQGAGIARGLRAGDKPSDHVPVWIDLAA